MSAAAIEGIASGIGLATSLIASVLWWVASRTVLPPFPDVGMDSPSKVFDPVKRALDKGARRNADAAAFSAVAALAACVSFGAHAWRTLH